MVTKSYTLPTPFGDVNCELKKGKVGMDIWITKDNYRSDYSSLCSDIIKFLSEDQQKELAEIILKYLEILPTWKGRVTNDFFTEIFTELSIEYEASVKYFDCDDVNDEIRKGIRENIENIEDAENSAAILSGMLFVAESSENRMFDGGKSARAVLRAIISGDKTFKEVFVGVNGKGPWYPVAKPTSKDEKGNDIYYTSGAVLARMRSMVNYSGENNFLEEEKKYYDECFEDIEKNYMSDSSVEESSDEE